MLVHVHESYKCTQHHYIVATRLSRPWHKFKVVRHLLSKARVVCHLLGTYLSIRYAKHRIILAPGTSIQQIYVEFGIFCALQRSKKSHFHDNDDE